MGTLAPGDFLCGALVLAQRKTKKEFLSLRSHELHGRLAPLSGQIPFVFSDDSVEPFSLALSNSFNALLLSGLIGYPDLQHPDRLVVKTSGQGYFEQNLLPAISEDERAKLEAVSNLLL